MKQWWGKLSKRTKILVAVAVFIVMATISSIAKSGDETKAGTRACAISGASHPQTMRDAYAFMDVRGESLDIPESVKSQSDDLRLALDGNDPDDIQISANKLREACNHAGL